MYSLPLIPPAFPDLLDQTYRTRPSSPPAINNPAGQPPQNHTTQRLQRQEREEAKRAHARSPLALLAADEAAIASRKAAIRNFGAHWIRPPGVSKTLQAMNEEEAERLEQEEIARQERGMADLEARQQFEELQAQRQAGGEEAEERDLDEEVPDADADASDAGEDEDPDDVEGSEIEGGPSGIEITQGSVSFNEDSMVGGSRVEGGLGVEDEEVRYAQELEEAELTGAARDEEDLGIEHERDLDDSVPEAGSYQHTDTELEDDDDDDSGLQDSFAGVRSARRSARQSSSAARSGRRSGGSMGAGSQGRSVMGPPGSGGRIFDERRMGERGSLQDRMRAQTGAGEALPRSPGSLNLDSSLLGSSFMGSSPMMTRGTAGAGRGRGGAGRGRGGVGRQQQLPPSPPLPPPSEQQENNPSARLNAQLIWDEMIAEIRGRPDHQL
ncbi:hypothetical protein MBLNU230_g6501t1 [Neophaeotheca triangularis]